MKWQLLHFPVSPWAGGKGQRGVNILQNILLSKQIFPSSGDSLKRKFLPALCLLQMSSRLDEIFSGFGYLCSLESFTVTQTAGAVLKNGVFFALQAASHFKVFWSFRKGNVLDQ